MMTVNQVVASAIEDALEIYGGIENVLKEHREQRWTKHLKVFNHFTESEMESLLNEGYKVRHLTPEEVLRRKYNELSDYHDVDRAMKDTFRYVLDTLNVKIEGINSNATEKTDDDYLINDIESLKEFARVCHETNTRAAVMLDFSNEDSIYKYSVIVDDNRVFTFNGSSSMRADNVAQKINEFVDLLK